MPNIKNKPEKATQTAKTQQMTRMDILLESLEKIISNKKIVVKSEKSTK